MGFYAKNNSCALVRKNKFIILQHLFRNYVILVLCSCVIGGIWLKLFVNSKL